MYGYEVYMHALEHESNSSVRCTKVALHITVLFTSCLQSLLWGSDWRDTIRALRTKNKEEKDIEEELE